MMNFEGEEDIGEEDVWSVVSAFFKKHGLVRQQLKSFDAFMDSIMGVVAGSNIEIRTPEVNLSMFVLFTSKVNIFYILSKVYFGSYGCFKVINTRIRRPIQIICVIC